MSKTIIKQKETFDRVVTLKYSDTGGYVDLTDCSAYCQMRTKPGGDLIATAECAITPDYGRVSASFSSDITAEIEPGEYGFDIWLVTGETKKPIHTEIVRVIERYTDNMED